MNYFSHLIEFLLISFYVLMSFLDITVVWIHFQVRNSNISCMLEAILEELLCLLVSVMLPCLIMFLVSLLIYAFRYNSLFSFMRVSFHRKKPILSSDGMSDVSWVRYFNYSSNWAWSVASMWPFQLNPNHHCLWVLQQSRLQMLS
jgi:hypothetical protein